MKGELAHGQQKRIAAEWGVSPATISRDYAVALEMTAGMIGSGIMPTFQPMGSRFAATWIYRG